MLIYYKIETMDSLPSQKLSEYASEIKDFREKSLTIMKHDYLFRSNVECVTYNLINFINCIFSHNIEEFFMNELLQQAIVNFTKVSSITVPLIELKYILYNFCIRKIGNLSFMIGEWRSLQKLKSNCLQKYNSNLKNITNEMINTTDSKDSVIEKYAAQWWVEIIEFIPKGLHIDQDFETFVESQLIHVHSVKYGFDLGMNINGEPILHETMYTYNDCDCDKKKCMRLSSPLYER